MHLEMPPWMEKLSDADIQLLADFVVDPSAKQEGQALFQTNCSTCHGERLPDAQNVEQAYQSIASGGAHQTMPIWGTILTTAQLDALVNYTMETSSGSSLEQGQQLFIQYCAPCHGEFGEGGPNPSRSDDIIAPISSSEYLKTRDDFTLSAIIAQGQPNLGMSPFGSTYGGPLGEEEISAIVGYIRAWQANPPVELPPEINAETLPLKGADIYQEVCAQCHGQNGEGGVGPSLSNADFQSGKSDQEIFDSISLGHQATSMIAWGSILSDQQINELVSFIRQFKPSEVQPTAKPPEAANTPEVKSTPETQPTSGVSGPPSFANDVMPIMEEKCIICHGILGGWDSSGYEAFMKSGNNAPVVIPGDPDNSLLMQKILGTQTEGTQMPPNEKLPESYIQIILNWIKAGALNN
jgi:mono/diheme cytochrome c family protein